MNWSGGKDSSLCLYKVLHEYEFDLKYLLTSINSVHNRISMHGVRIELLQLQAASIGIPLEMVKLSEQPNMAEYEEKLEKKILQISGEGIHHCIFGDIYLEDLRKYREEKLTPLGIHPSFPLWKISTEDIMHEFIDLGFKAIIVCVNGKFLDKSFCGRIIDNSFVNDLPENVDICGENGEFHSFVFDGPIFQEPVPFKKGEVIYREYAKPEDLQNGHYRAIDDEKNYGFYFCDLISV
jgi:uncharacterized protein (TIGR00290 family)